MFIILRKRKDVLKSTSFFNNHGKIFSPTISKISVTVLNSQFIAVWSQTFLLFPINCNAKFTTLIRQCVVWKDVVSWTSGQIKLICVKYDMILSLSRSGVTSQALFWCVKWIIKMCKTQMKVVSGCLMLTWILSSGHQEFKSVLDDWWE